MAITEFPASPIDPVVRAAQRDLAAKVDELATAVDRLTQMVDAVGINVGQLIARGERADEETAPLKAALGPIMAMFGIDVDAGAGNGNGLVIPTTGVLAPPPDFG